MQSSLSDCPLITSALCADPVDWDDLAMIEKLVCAALTDSQGCTLKDELVSIGSSLIDLILKLNKPFESWCQAKHWLST